MLLTLLLRIIAVFLCTVLCVSGAEAQQNPAGLVRAGTARVADRFLPLGSGSVRLKGGMLGARVDANMRSRLLEVDEDDLLTAFERRDVPPPNWQGEHVGKFLHAATLAWQNTGDAALKSKLDRVVARLLKTQEPDGYLGTYPRSYRWTSWDVWAHKYDLLGLLTYYQYTHDEASLKACRRIGDLLAATFGPGRRDINRSGEHVGMASTSVLEAMVLLYRATGEPRYLDFARHIVAGYDAPGGPAILSSLEKHRSVRRVANAKAYEMLSNFNGLLELYRASGDRRLLDAMRIAWQDVVTNRLYLTGSASSFERFQDEFNLPNGTKSDICETCVTVTWQQFNLQLLRLSGEPKYADQLEATIYNHLLAAQRPTGDDWAYYTPLSGTKPYDAATTCCHSSGPRGIALIPEVAMMADDKGGVVVNLYGSQTASARVKGGAVTLRMETDFPRTGRVVITLDSVPAGAAFPLRLRIPAWTERPVVLLNGAAAPGSQNARPGTYFVIDRVWRKGDTVRLDLPMPARLRMGEHGNAGRAAVTYGPLVLALDTSSNPGVSSPSQVSLSAATPSEFRLSPPTGDPQTGLSFTTPGHVGPKKDATTLTLTPFAAAGADGKSRFTVWVALPGNVSVFSGTTVRASRAGNISAEVTDTNDTYVVTYDGSRAPEDWYAVERPTPVRISRIVFSHGHAFHDGGWFDTAGGKPLIQVRTTANGPWKTVGTLESYPSTTATDPAGLRDFQKFGATFAPLSVVAVRILGRPASGDNPAQSFSSCAGLQAFGP